MLYVTPALYTEIQDIKREENIMKTAPAVNKLVQYARVGREVQRFRKLNPSAWKNKVKLPDIGSFTLDTIPMNLDSKPKRRKKRK